MGSGYHQFCPVAKAMDLLDERWTLLVVRELVSGSQQFNELRRGLPRMSPSLLSKRLQQLARAGIVERQAEGSDIRYVLTPAGQELRPVVEALGIWGTRWIGELGDEDLDPKLLLVGHAPQHRPQRCPGGEDRGPLQIPRCTGQGP